MSYKLYTDRKENFECKIYLKGASLQQAKSRIVIEGRDVNLIYYGSIDKDGKCSIPIGRLNRLLDEGDKGNIKLEVIAEDTYFVPWKSNFIVEASKEMKVTVKEQSKVYESKKPQVIVKEVKHSFNAINSITKTLNEQGVTQQKIIQNKQKIAPILNEYMNKVGYKKGFKNFIKEVVTKLSKR
tara:strand:+ start:2280 stop:2828 length:549 start_codon:yes stop_codon:yes gene_type:complete